MILSKRGLTLGNKRGQFFLIAAIIIIVVAVSIVTISNYTKPKDTVRLYDLGEELGIESQNILDYGTYSQLDDEEMKELMKTFITSYVSYIGETGNLYFVFGNKNTIYAVGYQELIEEDVCIKLNPHGSGVSGEECVPLKTGGETQEFTLEEEIQEVAVNLPDAQYEFRLKPGENFYFVIWQKIGEEKHVVTSEEG